MLIWDEWPQFFRGLPQVERNALSTTARLIALAAAQPSPGEKERERADLGQVVRDGRSGPETSQVERDLRRA